MLEAVVADGTGTKAAIDGYRVAGKTGTARKPPYDKPPYQYIASFAGFAPAERRPASRPSSCFDEPDRGPGLPRQPGGGAGVLPHHGGRIALGSGSRRMRDRYPAATP